MRTDTSAKTETCTRDIRKKVLFCSLLIGSPPGASALERSIEIRSDSRRAKKFRSFARSASALSSLSLRVQRIDFLGFSRRTKATHSHTLEVSLPSLPSLHHHQRQLSRTQRTDRQDEHSTFSAADRQQAVDRVRFRLVSAGHLLNQEASSECKAATSTCDQGNNHVRTAC